MYFFHPAKSSSLKFSLLDNELIFNKSKNFKGSTLPPDFLVVLVPEDTTAPNYLPTPIPPALSPLRAPLSKIARAADQLLHETAFYGTCGD